MGADDFTETRDANGLGSGTEGDEVRRVGDHFDDASLRQVGRFLLAAASGEHGQKLGGGGLGSEVLVFGIDAFFGDVAFKFVVFEIVLGGGAELAADLKGVLELDIVVVEEKLAGLFVTVFRGALNEFFGIPAVFHGLERCAADAGLHRGWRFGYGLKGRVDGGVECIQRGDDEAADGLLGDLESAGKFSLRF